MDPRCSHTFVALSFHSVLLRLPKFLSLDFRFIFGIFFQFPGGLPPGMPGMPPGAPRIDVPVSLGSSLLGPPRGSDPLMSLGPSAPGPSGPHNSGPGGMRAPNSNDKVTRLYFSRMGNPIIFCICCSLVFNERHVSAAIC